MMEFAEKTIVVRIPNEWNECCEFEELSDISISFEADKPVTFTATSMSSFGSLQYWPEGKKAFWEEGEDCHDLTFDVRLDHLIEGMGLSSYSAIYNDRGVAAKQSYGYLVTDSVYLRCEWISPFTCEMTCEVRKHMSGTIIEKMIGRKVALREFENSWSSEKLRFSDTEILKIFQRCRDLVK